MERIGDYILMDLIGKGGMGTVYRAFHHDNGRIVAVKVLARELLAHPTLRRRFELECGMASRLRHPNIVEGIAFGIEGDLPYLVMELVEGPNLFDHIRNVGPLPESAAVTLISQVASGLEQAHCIGLIHRDVKPDNILLASGKTAKLTDLGLAKDLQSEVGLTQSGTWIGTLGYMAPEQFGDAKNVDARTDVYGLSATLYYLLTGASPFPDKGSMTALGKKIRNDFLAPRASKPEISEMVNAAICLGLDAKPELRPASCGEFAALLTIPTDPTPRLIPDPTPSWAEKRQARRFPTKLEAELAALRGGAQRWGGMVLDVSLTGVLVQMTRRYQPGAVLEVRIPDGCGGSSLFLARVCWARPEGAWWNHGCAFGRALSEGDLAIFLQNKSSTKVIEEQDTQVS